MTLPQFLFIAIDKLFDGTQNKRKSTKFEDVDFVIEKDIRYDDNPEYGTLDTYHVKNNGEKYPVFFYIHGGGFVAGDKHYRRALSRWAANLGYFVVNVNYALGPKYIFPAGMVSLVDALNWVGANADKYNLDLDNMVVSGDSAGGYFSAMLACVSTSKELQKRFNVSTDLKFRHAVLNCGIYDVGAALSNWMPFNLTDKTLYDFGAVHVKDLDNYEYRSVLAPYELVDANFPKSFIAYAEKDMFCKGQGEKLIAKLNDLGVRVESHHSTTLFANHCYSLGWKGKYPAECVELMKDYLIRVKNKEI